MNTATHVPFASVSRAAAPGAIPAALQVLRDEHAALSAVLRSLLLMLDQGPGDAPELDARFASRDPMAAGLQDSRYDRLFTRIVLSAPTPVGVGPALRS